MIPVERGSQVRPLGVRDRCNATSRCMHNPVCGAGSDVCIFGATRALLAALAATDPRQLISQTPLGDPSTARNRPPYGQIQL
jgi:hypothetical protein